MNQAARRINVVGSSGSGKSTFARRIAQAWPPGAWLSAGSL